MTLVTTLRSDARGALDPRAIRRDFPIFERNPGLVFLDSGASAQKPAAVIDGVADYYRSDYANVHRGVYRLSARSTELYEGAREKVRRFLNAADASEIVFVRNATEGINLVAQSWGATFLEPGDEVLITVMEHHANIVPWQLLRDRVGLKLVVAPIDATGGLDMAAFEKLLSPRTKLVAVTQLSNVTGAILPVESIVRLAHARGAKVLLDGCQAAPRLPVDVQALDCDFYVFSGHKTYGPTGIGVLYGKKAVLDTMPPWQGGGDMILEVTFEKTTFQEPPHRFEAGTPDISGAIGLGIALDYLASLGRDAVFEHEAALTGYGVDRLSTMPGVHLLGAGQQRLAILSVHVDGIHPHDLATVLDQHKVAIRAGHHCAQPFMDRLGLAATARASLGVYNDESDVDAFVDALKAAQRMFKVAP
ncbi:MAG TPA: cysteine desulfurase [Stellaceae bacterium]|jgi:cysteine desulfurase/selenocysteine lyase|nr:cysteine desulfurase [Stellaceae bacterium]